jgi:hypothetical protein
MSKQSIPKLTKKNRPPAANSLAAALHWDKAAQPTAPAGAGAEETTGTAGDQAASAQATGTAGDQAATGTAGKEES